MASTGKEKLNEKMTNIPIEILACCVLHNISEIHGNAVNDRWLKEVEKQT